MANKKKKINVEPVVELAEEIVVEPVVKPEEELVEKPLIITIVGYVDCCTRLNVRAGKNTKSAVIEVIDYNSKVEITDEYDNWYGVITENGTKGFCMKQYIKI